MKNKIITLGLSVMLFAVCLPVQGEQVKKVPRIGFLSSTSASTGAHNFEAFREGLREFGYVDGKNITIEYRWAEGKLERLPDLAGGACNPQGGSRRCKLAGSHGRKAGNDDDSYRHDGEW